MNLLLSCARLARANGLVVVVALPLLFNCLLSTTTTTVAAASSTRTESPDSSPWVRSLVGIKEAFKMMQQAVGDFGKSNTRPPTKLKVVNVGFGRTGTTSFITALQQLGYTVIHDDVFVEVADMFERVYEKDEHTKMTPEEWALEAGARGFDVMGSGIMLPDEFLEWAVTQDDIKIVITLRDSPRKWAESFLSIQYAIEIFGSRPFIWLKVVRQVFPALEYPFRYIYTNYQPEKETDLDALMEGYEEHLKRIRRVVPPEKLLEFNVKQGWKPLCEFLNKPIPDTDFPHVNDRVVMKALLGTLYIVTWIWPLIVFIMVSLVWLLGRWGLRLLLGGSHVPIVVDNESKKTS